MSSIQQAFNHHPRAFGVGIGVGIVAVNSVLPERLRSVIADAAGSLTTFIIPAIGGTVLAHRGVRQLLQGGARNALEGLGQCLLGISIPAVLWHNSRETSRKYELNKDIVKCKELIN